MPSCLRSVASPCSHVHSVAWALFALSCYDDSRDRVTGQNCARLTSGTALASQNADEEWHIYIRPSSMHTAGVHCFEPSAEGRVRTCALLQAVEREVDCRKRDLVLLKHALQCWHDEMVEYASFG